MLVTEAPVATLLAQYHPVAAAFASSGDGSLGDGLWEALGAYLASQNENG